MADAEPGPEKYSLNEMMDRLKQTNGPEPEGVLVTRDDGTQAIRVRKRKRRSEQPAKERAKRKKRLRAIQITAGLSLGILGLLAAGGVLVYANTSPYRTRLLGKLNEATGSRAEVSQLGVTPAGASALKLDLRWPGSFVLKNLTLEKVEADLHVKSFLGGDWSGEEVLAQTASLKIGAPDGVSPPIHASTAESFFKFQRIRSPKATLLIGDPANPAVAVKDCELSFYPRNKGDRAELRMNRGTVSLGNDFPVFPLDRSLLIVNGNQIDVVALRFNAQDHPQSGFQLSGSITTVGEFRPATMDVKFTSFPLEQLTGRELGRFLAGPADSREAATVNFLTFVPGQSDSYRFAASWTAGDDSPIRMAELPCFSDLARLIGDGWFISPVFDGACAGTLRLEKNAARYEELDLHAKSRLRVTGSIAIDKNHELAGHLRLGIPPSFALADNSGRLHQLFSPENQGFRWVDIEISGTTTKPVDDFRQKLEGAFASPRKPSANKGEVENQFEELTRPR
ncbi:MAG TPA: hypothetical protein VIM57_10820 [Luteolibacter sp.]